MAGFPSIAGNDLVRDAAMTSVKSAVTNNPDAVAANVTREQWQHFLDTYKPVEDQALARAMQTDFKSEGDEAGQIARAGVNVSRGMMQRNLSRSGATLSAEERSAIGRRTNLTLAKAAGRAENTTRRGLSDSRLNLLRQMVQTGRNVANSATGSLQGVADMAAQREMQYKQQKAQATATNISSAASLAAIAIAFV